MAYEKQDFIKGQKLTAAQMNHIEDGLKAADDKAEAAANKLAVTTQDNGKFLRVVNGVATWVTITSAEGGSF